MATIRMRESAHIADLIVRAKAEGWVVGKVSRPASYGDVAILLPTRTSLGSLERALLARDVPYRVESRSLVWATDAVRDLVTMLQAIDSPSDEVAVLAALRHPGLACTDAALLEWRAAGGHWNYMAKAPESLPVDHPVAAGLSELRRWHEARWWMPVNELVASLVRELRLIELTATTKRPRDHWRRIRFVVDQSRAWCDAGGSGLGGFVDWAMRQIENEADVLETVVPEPDDDAVRILTVHGSKGLEFPITIVAGLASMGGRSSSLVWDVDGGPADPAQERCAGDPRLRRREHAGRQGVEAGVNATALRRADPGHGPSRARLLPQAAEERPEVACPEGVGPAVEQRSRSE